MLGCNPVRLKGVHVSYRRLYLAYRTIHSILAALSANDLGLTTAVPARSTIYADTYPRTIEIEANAGDPQAKKPVIYILDFKRISAKTAFWAGRPAMRVIQALHWFRDERSNLEAVVGGIVRYLKRSPHRQPIVEDLRENIHAIPGWMYQAIETITRDPRTPVDEDTPTGQDGKAEHAPELR
jgi:hypothetical protein